MDENNSENNTGNNTGLDKSLKAALCYAVGWLTGLVFLLIEKEDQEIRFHAMQSIIVFGALNLLVIILDASLVGDPLIPLISLASLVLWVLLIIKAYQGEHYKLPYAGDLAEKWLPQIKL